VIPLRRIRFSSCAKALVIVPGTEDGELNSAVMHTGLPSNDISNLFVTAESILNKIDTVAEKFSRDLDIAKLSHEFETTMIKFRGAVTEYEMLARENREPLKNTIVKMESSAHDLNRFIQTNDNRFEKAVDSFTNTSNRLSVFLDDIEGFSSVVDTMTVYLNSGEGTFSRLLKYDDLYQEMRQTNATIDSFVTDFRRNPGKYTKNMKFKVRLF